MIQGLHIVFSGLLSLTCVLAPDTDLQEAAAVWSPSSFQHLKPGDTGDVHLGNPTAPPGGCSGGTIVPDRSSQAGTVGSVRRFVRTPGLGLLAASALSAGDRLSRPERPGQLLRQAPRPVLPASFAPSGRDSNAHGGNPVLGLPEWVSSNPEG